MYLDARVPVLRCEPSSVQINPPVYRKKAVLWWTCCDQFDVGCHSVHLRNTVQWVKGVLLVLLPSEWVSLGKVPEINSLKDLRRHAASRIPSMIACTCSFGPAEAQYNLEGPMWQKRLLPHGGQQVKEKGGRGQILISPSRVSLPWPNFLSLDHT